MWTTTAKAERKNLRQAPSAAPAAEAAAEAATTEGAGRRGPDRPGRPSAKGGARDSVVLVQQEANVTVTRTAPEVRRSAPAASFEANVTVAKEPLEEARSSSAPPASEEANATVARRSLEKKVQPSAPVASEETNATVARRPSEEAEAATPGEAATKPGAKRSKQQMREHSLIKSLKGVGGGSMSCVTSCRYGEVRHGWRECLERCVENGLLRATLMTMLPAEHHDPLHPELEMPDELRRATERKRVLLKRSAEL